VGRERNLKERNTMKHNVNVEKLKLIILEYAKWNERVFM